MKFNNVYQELQARGLIKQSTSAFELDEHLNFERVIYCGFDPTGDSLHIGHLLPIIVLKHFERYNHKILAIVGGATGLIGDPSGKKEERKLNERETVKEYSSKIKNQLNQMLDENNTTHLNNYDWFSKISPIEFLRDYGKNFNINYMLNKDSVSSRLETGISFTEFSYTLIQAIDFYYLNTNYDCTIQIGGSDQWGNITSGLELIRKKREDEKAFGLTLPLVTKSDGTKFGKTAGQSIWLNPKKTTPYEFYQFLLNTEDSDVIKYLKYFTFLDMDEISRLEKCVEEAPFKREAQKKLAEEVTIFIHGINAYKEVIRITDALFSGDVNELSAQQIEDNFLNFPMSVVENNTSIADLLIKSELASSKREAREFITNNAININGHKDFNVDSIISKDLAIDEKYFIVKRGKKKFALVEVK